MDSKIGHFFYLRARLGWVALMRRRVGGLVGWRVGGLAGWRVGGLAGWRVGGLLGGWLGRVGKVGKVELG
ncbi:hypothetical protein [Paenibacillus qinlingensis]|uniref:hypothetical protein n=1 Tax=Paenibacillus qinlingensis TaxID=1837343 RepID=UPI001566A37D|nr:hypothetical protein [Paenibacillus qinlingensis]NQX60213.1 hypothetical protein [Paenibacillus qinlingensis]